VTRNCAHALTVGNCGSPALCAEPPGLSSSQQSVKRVVDVLGALCMMVLAAPVIVLAAILIRLTSAGPALYSQSRVGTHGREFSLYKLRTMVAGAERRTGPVMAASGDWRITGVGRFLRAFHIDELPQLFNVLAGQMSLIGPRPERPHFVRIFRRRVPGYELRLAVKPGITGLAQVCGGYSTSPEHKLRFDLKYICNYSFGLDAEILLRTILTVLRPLRSHARAQKPAWLPARSGD
jgi:lipopolysaccharide/colanic/teichoic acid biosynthesis glycosyltransferase